MPVYSVMNLISVETLKLASRPSVKGVYNTGSGLSALMDSHPPRFSPGRPHCVILWLDGSARCPLPLTAQAVAVRLLGILPVAPGQRVPYAYTDLFGFQGTKEKRKERRLIVSAYYVAQGKGRILCPFIL